MMNTKTVGEQSQAIIMAELAKAGKVVLLPFGDNQRYDLVLDEQGTFVRVQCKTGRLRDGAVVFATASSYAHRGGKWKDYRGNADIFAVYCPDTGKVYIISVDSCERRSCSLRVDPVKNGQLRGIRLAADYEL